MRAFTLRADEHGDFEAVAGVTVKLVAKSDEEHKYDKYGLDLGYYNPRRTDEEGSRLHERSFSVGGRGLSDGYVVEHVTVGTRPLHPDKEGDTSVRYVWANAVSAEHDAQQQPTQALVHLSTNDPTCRVRWNNAKELRQQGVLTEGRYEYDPVVRSWEAQRGIDICYPGVIVLNTNEPRTLMYRDKNGTLQVAEFMFNGETVERTMKREWSRDGAERRPSRPQPMGSLGEAMAEAGVQTH